MAENEYAGICQAAANRSSNRELMEAEENTSAVYKIRAHHGMCFAFFQGKGYSGAFTDNMFAMKERLAQNPEVVLLQKTDDVCARCPNDQDGECTSAEKVAGYDAEVLSRCGLRAGNRIRWKDFTELVREYILEPGEREIICGDCQWTGLCK